MQKIETWLLPSILVAALLAGTLSVPGPVSAQTAQQGISLYNKGKFKEALTAFNQATAGGHEDANVVYYSGLCYQQLREFNQAKACYQKVLQSYPQSSLKAQAQAALSAFYHGGGSNAAAGTSQQLTTSERSRGDSTDLSRCPQSSRVYYKDSENTAGVAFILTVQVNGRPIQMVFDTGAGGIVFGKNHLAQLGIAPPPPNRPPDYYSGGVGALSKIPTWAMTADVKVGDMLIPNCPISVMENLPTEPLLGQTFCKHFAYTVDYGSKSITFTKRDSGTSTVATSVPFVREGSHMVVQAQINGQPFDMYFDTGAMNCAFAPGHIKQLKLEVPDDAREGRSVGVGGETRSFSFPVKRIKLGPIEKSNMEISVVESSQMAHPLLGQTFYEGWQYTIDNEAKRINFLRR